jgi:hypothetical protein
MAQELVARHHYSVRQSCAFVELAPSSYYYHSHPRQVSNWRPISRKWLESIQPMEREG